MSAALASIIQTGAPSVEARYLVFVRVPSSRGGEWVEPKVMTWHGGHWHCAYIDVARVVGWIGPLPVLKVADIDGSGLGDGPMALGDIPPPTFAEEFPDCPAAPKPIAHQEYDL